MVGGIPEKQPLTLDHGCIRGADLRKHEDGGSQDVREWHRACARAGVPPIRLEWLRHTGASLAYAASKDMKAVASRLGHTSTRMMDTVYVELYEGAGRELADAIDVLVRRRLDGPNP